MTFDFKWIEGAGQFTAETPFGKAIICEVQDSTSKRFLINSKRYTARIEESSGRITTLPHIFDSFGSAEGHLFLTLQDICGNIEPAKLRSTLAFCRQVMMDSNETAHVQRLYRIEKILIEYFNDQQ